jgi:hypothetical protein
MKTTKFFQNCPIRANGACIVGLMRESFLFTGRGPSTLLSIVHWVSCLRPYCYLSVFLCVRNINFVPKLLFVVTESSSEYVLGKVWMLQAGGSSTLWSVENWVTCLKECCLPLSVFRDEEWHLCATSPLWREWKELRGSWKKIIYVRSKRV